jgi:hypothetical protein
MSAVLGETDYRSTGFANLNLVPGGYYCAGCNGSFELSFGTTSVTSGNGVFGVGFNFFNQGSPSYDARVTFGDGATQLYALGFASFPISTSFWGITSDRQIASISFGPGGGSSRQGSFGIDNLTIGGAGVIPEPATWAMLIIGFGLVGATARRRTSALA